jgi:hypothetical protein
MEQANMDQAKQYPENHPCHYTVQVKSRLQALSQHLREDVAKINEPKAQALFETSAEVLGGLIKAFEHYESGSERAFQ